MNIEKVAYEQMEYENNITYDFCFDNSLSEKIIGLSYIV
jgi:hypothetical protein